MAEEVVEKKEEAKRVHTYPLVRGCQHCVDVDLDCVVGKCIQSIYSDMSEEIRTEAMELIVTACEKFSSSNEAAAKMVKETMDKKFGAAWHVIIGEGYGFEITHETKNLLYMYFGGNMAIVLWKCS